MGKDKSKKSKDNKNNKSTYVYVKSDEHSWAPAVQLWTEENDTKAVIIRPLFKTEQKMLQCGKRGSVKYSKEEVVDLTDYPNGVLPMQNVDANGNLEDFKDMVALPFMHEAALLYNLKRRHLSEKPYTRTGDIVIAVNPYQWLDDLYTEKKRIYYANRLVWDHNCEYDPRTTMEPHVYEVSALSYKGLASGTGVHQSILVSGESGAGKTETVKICLNHIASMSTQGPTVTTMSYSMDAGTDPTVQRIVDSNPLLEAFGNAKTRRNDNSSRFGKYLQLQFNAQGGRCVDAVTACPLIGSKCEVYLLEKNRVVQHDQAKERTFHIFYQLLASPDSVKTPFWQGLAGTDFDSFAYVGPTDCTSIEGLSDAERFQETLHALSLVHVTGDRLHGLMQALCVVLQLGNLQFGPNSASSADESIVTSNAEARDLAHLLGVHESDLTQAFTLRTFETKTDTHQVPLNPAAAKEACDALAKELYQKIFLWLVSTINQATAVPTDEDVGLIGLLDIFGFEAFPTNRFEQLCINYANEKLQQKFTQDVFRTVQEEYEAEGIPLKDIEYDDNTDVLDLIEGRSAGLLALLNEECIRPGGNDMDFVQKALQANADSPCLVVHRTDRLSFGIHHYAGGVVYDAEGFVNRNQDTLPTDLQALCERCTNNEIISAPRSEPSIQQSGGGESSNNNRRGLMEEQSSRRRKHQHTRKESNIAAPTVWTKYRNQLSNLMTMLRQTRSRYIRCIKPNNTKAPLVLEHAPVVEQLRCAGVVAGITITRSVFPNNLENTAVLARYSQRAHMSANPEQRAQDCHSLLRHLLESKRITKVNGEVVEAFVVGKTKTYFRAGALEWLEMNRLSDLDAHAITLQRAARGWLARNDGGANPKQRARRQLEEQERLRQELEQQRQDQKARAAARKKEYDAKLLDLRTQLFNLKDKMAESDRTTRAKVKACKEKAERKRNENREIQAAIDERDWEREQAETKLLQQKQAKQIETNKQTIDSLKKENKKMRKAQEKIRTKHQHLMGNNQSILDFNSSMGDSFDNLNSATNRANDAMEDTTYSLNKAKSQNKKLREEVFRVQDAYMAQAEARLEYQKTMARLMNIIQDRCKDNGAVQETIVTALDCEGESKAIMAALEAETEPYLVASDVSESYSDSFAGDHWE